MMLQRIVIDFKKCLLHFPGKKRELFGWIFLRALNETLSPLMIPLIIRYMLDAFESQKNILQYSFAVFLIILPAFSLSYYIYVYSDAWVIKTMYQYQSNSLEKLCYIPPYILHDQYTSGDISYVINYGAWGMIQLWMKIFRVMGPLVGAVALLVYSANIMTALLIALIISILVDVICTSIHTTINFKYNEKIAINQGQKDEELRSLFQEIEFLVMNNRIQHAYKANDEIVNDYWRIMEKMILVDSSFEAGTILTDAFLRKHVYDKAYSRHNDMTSGQIGTINQLFDNVRDGAGRTRNQITTLPELLVPVEKIDKLLNFVFLEKDDVFLQAEKIYVSIKNLYVSFEENNVLDGVSLRINYGDKIAIVGSNGAGKSTLLKTILGIIEPTCGDIFINDCRLQEIGIGTMRNIFSFLPSNLMLFTSSSEENINMNNEADFSKLDLNAIMKNSSFFENEIDEILIARTNELSGGQAQRIGFGRAISSEKKIYIFDEPTSSLDSNNATHIMQYIYNNLNTMLFTTHNIAELDYSNRVIYMDSGKVIFDGSKIEFLQSKFYRNWAGDYLDKGTKN